jgi:hypothetical protein
MGIPVKPNDGFHRHPMRLASVPARQGGITRLRFDLGLDSTPDDRVKLAAA